MQVSEGRRECELSSMSCARSAPLALRIHTYAETHEIAETRLALRDWADPSKNNP